MAPTRYGRGEHEWGSGFLCCHVGSDDVEVHSVLQKAWALQEVGAVLVRDEVSGGYDMLLFIDCQLICCLSK